MSNTMRGREAGEGSTPKKRSKTRSLVWEHFTKVNGGTRAECNYCKNVLSYSEGTTSHLKRHHNSCNKAPNGGIARTLIIAEKNERAAMNQPPTIAIEEDDRNFDPTIAFGEDDRNFDPTIAFREDDRNFDPMIAFGMDDRNFDLTPEKIREVQVKHAILAGFPIAPPNFKKVWGNLMLMDMEKEICAYHQREKDKLVAELGNLTSRVCFSFEIMKETCWISITAHFINDDFKLVKRLIGLKKLPDYASELCEADIIESCISDWKLGNKIFSFTTKWDDHLIGSFREKFRSKLILDGNNDRDLLLPCFKMAIVDFYSEVQNDISVNEDDLVFFIKKVVMSPMGKLKFNEIAKEKGLPPINEEWSKGLINLYSGTQDWKFCHSAVKLVKEALLYKEVLCERSLTEICQHDPNNISWTELEEVVNFFETINPIIDLLSNSKYPTSNLYYPSLEKINGSLDHQGCFLSIPYTSQVMHTLCVACALDPRYKLTFFEYLFGNVHSNIYELDFCSTSNEEVRDFFDIMFSRYAKEKPNQSSPSSLGTANTQEGSPSSIFSDPGLLRNIKSYPLYIKELRTTKREMDQYLREEVVDEDTNFDLLGWWKENRSRYPILSRMVRDFLAVPACSVKESLRIDLSALQGVSPELAEAVICSKNWILSDG